MANSPEINVSTRIYDKMTMDKAQEMLAAGFFYKKYQLYARAVEIGVRELYRELIQKKSSNEIQEKLADIEELIRSGNHRLANEARDTNSVVHCNMNAINSSLRMMCDLSCKRKIAVEDVEKGMYNKLISPYKDQYFDGIK